MKITQEQFDKLKQLDRIEYRQKYLINENNYGMALIWSILFAISTFLPIFFSVISGVFLVNYIYTWLKNRDNLTNEYFKSKVEVKK